MFDEQQYTWHQLFECATSTGASREVEGMSHNGCQNNEISCSSMWVDKILALSSRSNWNSWKIFSYELNWKQFITTSSQFIVFTNLHLFIPHGSSFVRQCAISFEKLRKLRFTICTRFSCWPAAHLLDIAISWFSAKLGFQAIWGDFVPQICILTMCDVKEKPSLCDIQKFSVWPVHKIDKSFSCCL